MSEVEGQVEEQAIEGSDGVEQVGQEGNEPQQEFNPFETTALHIEAKPADAHEADITGVTCETFDSGAVAIKIHLSSRNEGFEDSLMVWMPAFFVENCAGFFKQAGQTAPQYGIEDLPPGEPDPNDPKRIRGNQRSAFGRAIKNDKGDASIQSLITIATKSGRTYAGQGITASPQNFEDYVGMLGKLLTDLYVVFTRTPQKDEQNPQFDGRLKVNRIYFPADAMNPKALKKYRRAWEG